MSEKMITIPKKDFNKLYLLACKTWKDRFNEMFKYQVFSDELEFEENFLYEMEKACDDKQLPVFKSIFKKFLTEKEDLFSITNYQQVCKALKEKELTMEDFKNLPSYMQEKSLNQAKLSQIERLFNGNWKANWSDHNQQKWYVYFESHSGGGLVFHGSCCHFSGFHGMATFYKDEKIATHCGKHFINIYKGLL